MKCLYILFATMIIGLADDLSQLEKDLMTQAIRQNTFVIDDGQKTLLYKETGLWTSLDNEELIEALSQSVHIDSDLATRFVSDNQKPSLLNDNEHFSIKTVKNTGGSPREILNKVDGAEVIFLLSKIVFNKQFTKGIISYKKMSVGVTEGAYLLFEKIGQTWSCVTINDAPSLFN